MRKLLFAIFILAGLFLSCRQRYSGTVYHSTNYDPGTISLTAVDSGMLSVIDPYQQKLNEVMSEVLVRSDAVMEKGKPESTLGNFVADACWAIAIGSYKHETGKGLDFCLLNNGGLRSALPAGAITKKQVFELMPFENELVVVTLSGSTVLKIVDFVSKSGGVPVSNLQMIISGDSSSQVSIGGQPFDPSHTYRLLTSDYLANGGDSMSMFSEKLLLEPLGIKVRDAIIQYMKAVNNRGETLKPILDGRISK